MAVPQVSPARSRIPLWIKIVYSLFAVFFVAVQLSATPLLLLYLCNAAIIVTMAGIWLESRLVLSTQLLAVFWPQLIWQIDFVAKAALGMRPFAAFGLNATDYMFDPGYPLIRRVASFQHAWLVWLLLWLVCRLGYDRRALIAQTAYAWALILVCVMVVPSLHGPAGNVNYIFGPSNTQPQTLMPHWAWLMLLMVFLPLCQYAPLHFVLRRIVNARKGRINTDDADP